MTESVTRKPRSDGERSRQAILREAAKLATVEGIEGITIGRLASEVGMSKSGLFAHFGSKEDLQLATVDAATAVYEETVIDPALAEGTGIERLRALLELFLRHVEAKTYPGGCFFASVASEVDAREGPVRDLALEFMYRWLGLIESAIEDAQAEGAIDPAEDPAQLTYELESYTFLANLQFVITDSPEPTAAARVAIDRRLREAAPA